MDEAAPLLAGIELGGTKCICILARGPGTVEDMVELPTRAPQETLAAIAEVLARWPQAAALGIASFGPLDLDPASPNYGSLVATTKPGWSGASLRGLAPRGGLPVAIDTDVNGAALAEGLWGGAQGLTSWAYVTVGTGIGVGSIVAGQPVRGLGHSEAGHMRVPRAAEDWPGICPFHGDCVEGLASGPAIEAHAGKPSRALAPDHSAWGLAADAIAAMCHNLVYTTCPERILIGGGVATGQPHMLPMIRERLAASLGNYAGIAVDVQTFVSLPALWTMAGPLGAIALARSALTNPQ